MTPSEYRYQIEKIYAEVVIVNDWLLTDLQFLQFATMAKTAGSGKLVLENWELYLSGGGEKDADSFYEWWSEYRPDKLENPVVVDDKKKSPFDAVRDGLKKKVRIE